MYTLHPTVKIK